MDDLLAMDSMVLESMRNRSRNGNAVRTSVAGPVPSVRQTRDSTLFAPASQAKNAAEKRNGEHDTAAVDFGCMPAMTVSMPLAFGKGNQGDK